MVDHRVEGHLFETGEMVGLGIDQDLFAVILHRQGVEPFDGDFQTLHHGQVVEAPDLVGIADDDAVHPVAEQPFERQGRGDGVRIGADDDEDVVAALKDGPQTVEPGHGGVFAGAARYIVVGDLLKSFLHRQGSGKNTVVS